MSSSTISTPFWNRSSNGDTTTVLCSVFQHLITLFAEETFPNSQLKPSQMQLLMLAHHFILFTQWLIPNSNHHFNMKHSSLSGGRKSHAFLKGSPTCWIPFLPPGHGSGSPNLTGSAGHSAQVAVPWPHWCGHGQRNAFRAFQDGIKLSWFGLVANAKSGGGKLWSYYILSPNLPCH